MNTNDSKPRRRGLARYPLFAEQVGAGIIVAIFVVPLVVGLIIALALKYFQ